MLEKFPKFLIIKDQLVIRKVTYHKELVTDGIEKSDIKGGGWFKYDDNTSTFILYGDSHDYGKATFEDVVECIKNNNVVQSYNRRGMRDMNIYNFAYTTEDGVININKDGL